VVFWTVSSMTLITGAISAPHWVPIEHGHWPILIALGVLAAIAQYLLTEAFRSASPAVVAPFEYTALLWGIAIDRVVWHVLPSLRVLLGGGIVIASGLYLIWHERARAATASPQQHAWKWSARQGRMSRRSSTVEDVARQQEEDSP
jgi:drug/metabolite transporter (DMT)-like permease